MKKIIASLLALLCVFGSQPITMYAEENSSENENSTENTNTDNTNSGQETNGDSSIEVCSTNKGAQ